MKKILSVVLALAMMLIMAMPAFAANDNTITITNDVASTNVSINQKEYSAYKIFDVKTKSADGSAVVYSVASEFADFEWKEKSGDELIAALEKLEADSTELNDFAKELYDYIYNNGKAATQTVTASNETASFTGLEDGYYLVYGSSQSYKDVTDQEDGTGKVEVVASAMLLNTDAEIQVKASAPIINKTVLDSDDGSGNGTAVEIGDTVTFQIEATIPDMTGYDQYTYNIYDCMTSGLTYTEGTLKVKVDDVDYTGFAIQVVKESTQAGHEGHTEMKISFPQILQLANNEKIVVTYDAVLNENAKTTVNDVNNAKIEYSNDPYNEGEASLGETPWDPVFIFDFNIRIDKVDEEGNPLGGAKFALKNSENKYYCMTPTGISWQETCVATDSQYVVTTDDETGYARFYGLDAGTYYLEEISAPAGYNKLTEDIEVVVNPYWNNGSIIPQGENFDTNITWDTTGVSGAVVAVEVENTTGTLLPSTGGMGTVIFYVVGGMLVLGSVVVMVTKRRMNATR